MQGKLYQDSSSIYEDEARILFDYFSQAADRIIEEENKATARIEEAKDSLNRAFQDGKKKKIRNIILFIFALIGAVSLFYIGEAKPSYIVAGLAVIFFFMFINQML